MNETPAELGVRAIQQIASQPMLDVGGAQDAVPSPSAAQQSLEERHARIAAAAYQGAAKRGFAAGGELDDWLTAEREVLAEDAGARADGV